MAIHPLSECPICGQLMRFHIGSPSVCGGLLCPPPNYLENNWRMIMNMFDKQLAFAIRGVTYPSDSDPQPLERFRWNVTETTIDEGTVCEWSGESIDGPTTVLNYTEFMAPRMTTGDQVPQYVTINGIMTGNLTDLTVYRFGSVNVRFYVMGLDAIGNITGWKTSAVQS